MITFPSAVPVILILLATGELLAQASWQTFHTAPPPVSLQMCPQAAFGNVLCLASRDQPDCETWEWTGARWCQRHPASPLPARQAPALAYDVARGVVVAFGGIGQNLASLDDTWEWDGLDWNHRVSPSSPSPRYSAGMAYDSQRRRCVLFGGDGGHGRLGDHWEWDGAHWTQVLVQGLRPPVSAPMLTYDQQRGRLVLCPHDLLVPSLEVWEFDGAAWSHPQPAVRPPGLNGSSIAYDSQRGRTVVYGGRTGILPTRPNTTFWEWDGSQWHSQVPVTPLGDRPNIGFAYDASRRRIVLTGGNLIADTWTYDPQTRTWTDMDVSAPFVTRQAAYDGNDHSLVMDYGGTFLWDHTTRAFERLGGAPPPPSQLAMAFDLARQQAMLLTVGGGGSQTWLWDAPTRIWAQAPVVSPPPRTGAMLAYDAARGECVLFGGFDSVFQRTADTWLWDGAAWGQAFPVTSPSARVYGAMAYDPTTSGVVLVGGEEVGARLLDDVWDWNGVDWVQRQILTPGPAPSHSHALVTRSTGVTLLGGHAAFLQQVPWQLQGQHWLAELQLGLEPVGKVTAVGDPNRDEVTVFAGHLSLGNIRSGVWLLGQPMARVVPFASGCPGTTGRPELVEAGLPSLGNPAFALNAQNLPALQPALFVLGLRTQVQDLLAGCRLFVAPDAVVFRPVGAAGTSTLGVPIPPGRSFLGLTLHVQAGALDPATTLAMTPPVTVHCGW